MAETDIQNRIAAGVDLRDEIPDTNIYKSERVLDIEIREPTLPQRHLSAAKAILDLTAVSRLCEVGMNGPANAANATEAGKHDRHFRLYEVFFPRDAHVVAYFLHERFPELTRATVSETLKYTGVRDNLRTSGPKDEQELGKAPHEIRDPLTDALAQQLMEDKQWGFPYYGAVDTTGKNIKAILRACDDDINFLRDEYEGLDGKTHTIEDGLRANINWTRKRMDFNQEGLVESLFLNPLHHPNQSWDDSPIAFHHQDGRWARHHPDKNWGVASVEVQAEIYDALVGTARLYSKLATGAEGQRKKFLDDEIEDLTARASKLRQIVLEKFWIEDASYFGGYFARGTDRDEAGRLWPLAVRSSGMGHLLNSGILDGNDLEVTRKRESVIKNLFSPEMLCPNGFRTLSSDSKLYGEERYHNGNSWPWVTYYIAKGLERHGYYGLAYEAKKRAMSLYEQTRLLPEYGTGSSDPARRLVDRKIVVLDRTLAEKPIPGFSLHQISQWAQEIQAWTAAAVLAMKYEHGVRLFHPERTIPIRAQTGRQKELEQKILGNLAA